MSTFLPLRRMARRAMVLAACMVWCAGAAAQSSPDALLSIDRNRATVIERIVAEWGDSAGIERGQLRQLLERMRADQLLAASLAGSVEGLRGVMAGTPSASDRVKAQAAGGVGIQALGDAGSDVVYTPVTPCRLVETRGTFAAVYQGDGTAAHNPVPFAAGETRNYTLLGGNGQCLSQLPAGINAAGVQLQVFAIPANGVSGDVEILPQGSAFGSTATLVFLGNLPFTSAGTTARANQANNQIGVQVRSGIAHVAIDVVGYFAAPVATALQCATVAGTPTVIPVSSDTAVALPSCAAGYTRTGSQCSGGNNTPSAYLVEVNATACVFRNLSAVATYNGTASSVCCRIPGR